MGVMSKVSSTTTVAVLVVGGSFAYIIIRGGSDPVVMPLIAGALMGVLNFFFARQIADGAATKSLDAVIEVSRARVEVPGPSYETSTELAARKAEGNDAPGH